MINATQIRVGNFIKLNGEIYSVLKIQHVTPGKGNAVVQTELRNLKTGIKTNNRFRSTETVEEAILYERKLKFLYQDGDHYHFMNPEDFEQVELNKSQLEDLMPFLQEDILYSAHFYEGTVMSITPPTRMTFEVTETDPPSKNKTGSSKNAILENGIQIKVPQFTVMGDRVVIDTREQTYVEKE